MQKREKKDVQAEQILQRMLLAINIKYHKLAMIQPLLDDTSLFRLSHPESPISMLPDIRSAISRAAPQPRAIYQRMPGHVTFSSVHDIPKEPDPRHLASSRGSARQRNPQPCAICQRMPGHVTFSSVHDTSKELGPSHLVFSCRSISSATLSRMRFVKGCLGHDSLAPSLHGIELGYLGNCLIYKPRSQT